jgi:hypothetical protein
VLTLSNGSGAFVIGATGLAGRIGGTVTVNPALGLTFTGTFSLAINNTSAAVNEQFKVGGQTIALNLPAGPYVRVEGLGITLGVLGQTLSGDFAFEQVTTAGATPQTRVRIGLTNISLALGAAGNPALSVSGGTGFFLITPAGLAGTFSANVALNVPSVAFSGSFSVTVKTIPTAVNETFLVGVTPVVLKIDELGQYLRVSGTNLSLSVLGQTLSGNFSFEQFTAGTAKKVRISASNVSLSLGGGIVSADERRGQFRNHASRLAGRAERRISR